MHDCIFCKIANKEISSHIIWENKDFLAFLDIFPNRRGMTVVIPKKHYDSDPSTVDKNIMAQGINAVQEVMLLLKTKLGVPRIGLVIEGLEVQHLHFKLYPFRDNKGFPQGVGAGPKAHETELEALATTITS